MKIKSLYIDKLKTFKDFKIEFNDSVNAIIGENGLGKTTILETIYYMISGYEVNEDTDSLNNCSIEISLTEEEIEAIKKLSGESFKANDKILLNGNEFNKHINCHSCGSNSNAAFEKGWFNKVVYLPTDVNFKKHKVNTPKNIEEIVNIGKVLNSDNMSIDLKEYLVNIHYKDLEDLSFGDKPYRIEKFKQLYNSFFEKKEFLGVKNFEPLFKSKETGEIYSVDQLSAGEKQIFFRGGSLLQMNLNNSIILIDEPELSLHPEWQQKILNFYQQIGENNQIIIATHSPHIISSCKQEEVIALTNKNGNTIVKQNIEETYGWTVEQLLLSVFEMKSVRNPEVQAKLDKFKALYIDKVNLDSEKLNEYNKLKIQLEKYLDPEDPSFSLINIEESSKKLDSIMQRLKSNKHA